MKMSQTEPSQGACKLLQNLGSVTVVNYRSVVCLLLHYLSIHIIQGGTEIRPAYATDVYRL